MRLPPSILIISSSSLCRNPRVLKEATTLGHAGYNVTVLTIAGREQDESIDRELLREAPFKKIALPYFGFHGTLGLGAHAGRTFTALARKLVPFGIERRSALGAFHRLRNVAFRTPADLSIVHTELGLAIGCELIKTGRKIATDFEDWHSHDLLPAARRHRPQRLLAGIETNLLSKSAYCSTTSVALADALHAACGGTKPFVITNSFPLQLNSISKNVGDIPSLFWFSQTIGPGRGLEAFIQSWDKTSAPSRLVLLGEISSQYRSDLLSLISNKDKSCVAFLSPCIPGNLPAQIARHDIGLALEETSPPSRNLTITNKILQYLNAGLAVVATNTAGHREVLAHGPEAGITVDSEAFSSFTAHLDTLILDRAGLTKRKAAARQLAESKFSWEREAPQLQQLVDKALSS